MRKRNKIYMLVTSDKYELPIMVCDTVYEMARKLGVCKHSIWNALLYSKRSGSKSKYVEVIIDDD